MPVMALVEMESLNIRDDNKIQIVFSTPSGAVEEKIRIVFPQGYSLNNNIEFDTENLAQGATPLPINGSKIMTSNGLIVEININDLIRDTKYGFNIISGAVKGNVGSNYWRISTIANGVEDSYKNAVGSQLSTLTITVITPPLINDFFTNLISSNDGNLPPDHEVEFTITYGSDLPYTDTGIAILTAQWSDELGMGLWDYVLNSASLAYDDTLPVLDLINNKITWNIKNLPKNKIDHQVKFKLRSNNLYNGENSIKVSVASRITRDKLSTPDSLVNLYYKNNKKSENIINQTTITSTSTISPTPLLSNPVIENGKVEVIELTSVDSDEVKIKLDVSGDLKTIVVRYGLSEDSLLNEVTLLVDSQTAWLNIPGLEPGKSYFMKIVGSNDIFSFKTAEKSIKSEYESGSLILSSQNNIILASKAESVDESAVLVKGQEYSIRLGLDKSTAIKEAKIYVRNKKILGVNSDTRNDNSEYVKLLEYERGIFVGNLNTPKEIGEYEIYLRLTDYNGNISENKVGRLKVVSPLIIKNTNNIGIEKAKIILSVFNQSNNIYEEIKSTTMNIKNPVYSESNGDVLIALPKGKYRASIEALGYENKEIYFEIGLNSEQKYPEIFLDKKPFSFDDISKFYKEISTDICNYTNKYLDSLAQSYRFFYLIMIIVIAVLIGLSVLSLSFKVQIPVWLLPIWLWFVVRKKITRDKQKIIEATILDEDHGWPISRVRVFLMDTETNKIISKTYTDRLGIFRVSKPKNKLVKFVVFKKGWEEIRELNYSKEALDIGGVKIEMRRINETIIEKSIKLFLINILEMLFEVIIIITILFESIFVFKFGVLKTMPFLFVSIMNLLIWLVFVYKMTKKNRNYEKLV